METLGASPATYFAPVRGTAYISGGTVSSITLTRGAVSGLATGVVAGAFPLAPGDSLVITYSVVPVLNFLPF